MTAFHDGADQEAGLTAARTALQNTRSGDNAEGLSDQAAMRADKAVSPDFSILRTAIRNLVFERTIDAGHNDLYDHPAFAAAAQEALERIEADSGEKLRR